VACGSCSTGNAVAGREWGDVALGARWTVLADDLTGAADAALAFWRPGWRVHVYRAGAAPADGSAEVLAISCGWRDDPAGRARFLALLPPSPTGVLIKVDSTLRGPVAEMIGLCRQRWPQAPLRFCPALPAQGRVVRGGRVLVRGRAIATPPGVPPPLDASDDADLRRIVATAPPGSLFVGSAGLAAALAAAPPPAPAPGCAAGPRVLVVAGSRQPATATQLRRLHDPCVRDAALGALLADRFPALVLTGGFTAAEVLRRLGLPGFAILGAVAPGVPWGRAGRWLLATKAGGFGDADALRRACDALRTGMMATGT
jgi:uncharacterized protein YgbK (DUF1537 family)